MRLRKIQLVLATCGILFLSGCSAYKAGSITLKSGKDNWYAVTIDGEINQNDKNIANTLALRAAEKTLEMGKRAFLFSKIKATKRTGHRITYYGGVETSRFPITKYDMSASFRPLSDEEIPKYMFSGTDKPLSAEEVCKKFLWLRKDHKNIEDDEAYCKLKETKKAS